MPIRGITRAGVGTVARRRSAVPDEWETPGDTGTSSPWGDWGSGQQVSYEGGPYDWARTYPSYEPAQLAPQNIHSHEVDTWRKQGRMFRAGQTNELLNMMYPELIKAYVNFPMGYTGDELTAMTRQGNRNISKLTEGWVPSV